MFNELCGRYAGVIAYTRFEDQVLAQTVDGVYDNPLSCTQLCSSVGGGGFSLCTLNKCSCVCSPSIVYDQCVSVLTALVSQHSRNAVDHNACHARPDFGNHGWFVGQELGFRSFYQGNQIHLSSIKVGVVPHFDSQAFLLEGSEGFIHVELESVDVASYSSLSVSALVRFNSVSWDSQSSVLVWVDSIKNSTSLVTQNFTSTLLNGHGVQGEWQQYGARIPDSSWLTVKFGLRMNGVLVSALIDHIQVTGAGPIPKNCTGLNRCRTLQNHDTCGECLYSHAPLDSVAGDSMTRCLPAVDCGTFTVVNGTITGESFFGGVGAFTKCHSTHVLRGLAHRICHRNGTWDGVAPKCIWAPLLRVPDFRRNCSTWDGRVISVKIPWQYDYVHQFDIHSDILTLFPLPSSALQLTLSNSTCTTACKLSMRNFLNISADCSASGQECQQQCRLSVGTCAVHRKCAGSCISTILQGTHDHCRILIVHTTNLSTLAVSKLQVW